MTTFCIAFYESNLSTLRQQEIKEFIMTCGHRLNMELDLQSLFGLLCTDVYSLAETPQLPLPPAFGLIYEGAKIDGISL
jgi:hypothetical protein